MPSHRSLSVSLPPGGRACDASPLSNHFLLAHSGAAPSPDWGPGWGHAWAAPDRGSGPHGGVGGGRGYGTDLPPPPPPPGGLVQAVSGARHRGVGSPPGLSVPLSARPIPRHAAAHHRSLPAGPFPAATQQLLPRRGHGWARIPPTFTPSFPSLLPPPPAPAQPSPSFLPLFLCLRTRGKTASRSAERCPIHPAHKSADSSCERSGSARRGEPGHPGQPGTGVPPHPGRSRGPPPPAASRGPLVPPGHRAEFIPAPAFPRIGGPRDLPLQFGGGGGLGTRSRPPLTAPSCPVAPPLPAQPARPG